MRKFLLYTFLVLTLLTGVIAVYLKHNLDHVLKDHLETAFNEAFRGQYILKASRLRTNFFTGSASLENISFRSVKSEKNPVLGAKIESLELSGVSWSKYFKSKDLQFTAISINKPDVFFRDSPTQASMGNNNLLKVLPEFLSQLTNSFTIARFEINNGKVVYITGSEKAKSVSSGENFNLKLSDISILKKKTPTLIAKHSEFSVENLCFTRNKKKEFSAGQLKGNSKDSTFSANEINFQGFALNQYKLSGSVNNITTEGFNIPETFASFSLNSRKIKIYEGNLHIHEVITRPAAQQKDTSNSLRPNTFYAGSIEAAKLDVVADLYNSELKKVKYSGEVNFKLTALTSAGNGLKHNGLNLNVKNFTLSKSKNEKLTMHSISADELGKSLVIGGLNYFQKNKSGKNEVLLNIPQIKVAGITKAESENLVFKGEEVLVLRPVLYLETGTDKGKGESLSLNQLIEKFGEDNLYAAAIKNLKIVNGSLTIAAGNSYNQVSHMLRSINLSAQNMHVMRGKKDYPLDNFKMEMGTYTCNNPEGNFTIQAHNILADSRSLQLSGENISVAQIRVNEPDQPYSYTNSLKAFTVKGFSFQALLNSGKVVANQFNGEQFKLNIREDENRDKTRGDKKNYSTRDLLALIPFVINIGKITLSESSVRYELQPEGRYQPAVLNLEKLSYSLTNFSNAAGFGSASQIAVSAMLEGKAKMQFNMHLKLNSDNLDCSYSGKVGYINGTEFNDWLALTDFGIKKGEIDNLAFNISIQNNRATGKLAMLYHNLRLNIYNSRTGKKNKITSFFSRLFVNKNNKGTLENPGKAVEINSDIPPSGTLYSVWLPIKDGMLQTVKKDIQIPGF